MCQFREIDAPASTTRDAATRRAGGSPSRYRPEEADEASASWPHHFKLDRFFPQSGELLMSGLSFASKLFGGHCRRRRTAVRKRPRHRPVLEALDDRVLLS